MPYSNFNTCKPMTELEAALEKLENFTNQQTNKSSLLTTVKHVAARLHTNTEDEHEVLEAIETVKSHYLFILDKDSAFAKRAMRLFETYNALIDEANKASSSWISRLFSRKGHIKKLQKIQLPRPASMKIGEHPLNLNTHTFTFAVIGSSKKVDILIQETGISAITPTFMRETDAFRMKVFSLFDEHQVRFGSKLEELEAVKKTHIYTKVQENSDGTATVSHSSTFSPYPGELITVTGSFHRNPHSRAPSIPIADSFKLTSHAAQTGYPYPMQHHGGCMLADQQLPTYPHRPEQLPLFSKLDDKKKNIAQQLLPNGSLNQRGKHLLRAKRQIPQEKWLPEHQKLSLAIMKAAPESLIRPDAERTIIRYYAFLSEHFRAFDYLAETHHLIIENFIFSPYNALKKKWLDQSNPELISSDPHIRHQAALKILEQEVEQVTNMLTLNRATADYVDCVGHILATPAHSIILQHLSEMIACTPPMLNDFEQKVQALVYKQLYDFFKELEQENGDVEKHLIEHIRSDTALFESDTLEGFYGNLVNELEVYFNSRHYSRYAK